MEKNSKFNKHLTYQRIKGILSEFVGGKKKGITSNHIIGQMRYAIKNGILSIGECKKIICEIETAIRENRLFPYGPLSLKERLERLEEVKKKFKEVITNEKGKA